MFSKQNTFGASSSGTGFGTFGNTSNTASPFGNSFAKPAATFGQPSAFGAQNTGLFGASQPTTGLFNSGTTNTFGSTTANQTTFGGFNQPQTSTSLFGTPQQTTQPSLFGQNNTSAFGQQNKPAFGFNQTQPTNSIFGQTPATSSTFGSSFGTQQNTSVFGSAGTAFGQNNQQQTANAGSSIAKYQPSIGTDTLIKNGQPNNVSTKQHCITAMKEYENKSLEEIRYEDYLSNRKGAQAGGGIFSQQPASTGLFGGNTQQGTGLFGQTTENKPIFGNTTLGAAPAFGQNTTQPAFGQNTQNPGGLFSKSFTTPATNANTTFGGFGTTDNSFGKSPFNQTSAPNLFGQNTAPTSTGFGQTPAFGNTFGTNNQQPSLFGNTSTATSSTGFTGFGNNSTTTAGTGLFGSKPTGFGTNTFGAQPTSTAGFGANTFGTQQNTSLFNTSGLNKPATSGFGGFGTAQPGSTLGGLNTANTAQGGLFSNQKPGGLFGTNTLNTGGSMFGNNTMLSNTNPLPNFNAGFNNTSSFLGGQAQQQPNVPVHQQILAMSTLPYGENQIIKDMKLSSNFDNEILKPTNPQAQKAILENSLNNFKVQHNSSPGIKTKSITDSLTKKSLFDGLESFDNSLADNFKLKSNAKRLIIKPKVDTNTKSINLDYNNKENLHVTRDNTAPSMNLTSTENASSSDRQNTSMSYTENKRIPSSHVRDSWLSSNILDNSNNRSQRIETNADETIENSSSLNVDEENNNSSLNRTRDLSDVALQSTSKKPNNVAGVVLNRVGYYMIPPQEELEEYMDEDGNCIVPTLTIGREGYGNVFFNQPINVTNMNLDEIVHIRYKQITIYPDDDSKPPEGEGLNTEAQVTLDQVWPIDKTLHEPIKDAERLKSMNYEEKLRNVCYKQNMRFLEYNPETGSWVFKVKHFSKYGLTESDEEDDSVPDLKKLKTNTKADKEQELNKKHSNTFQKKPTEMITEEIETEQQETNLTLDKTNYNPNLTLFQKETPTDVHKLQLMKASFFFDSNDEQESPKTSEKNYQEKQSLFLLKRNIQLEKTLSKSMNMTNEFDYEAPPTLTSNSTPQFHNLFKKKKPIVEEHDIEPEPLYKHTDLYVKPMIAPNKININESFIKSKVLSKLNDTKCLADTGLMTGYRFKVSFNTLNTFFSPAKLNSPDKNPKKEKIHNSIRLLNSFEINYSKPNLEENNIIPHLDVYLDHIIRQEVENSDCPQLKCGGDLELIQSHCEVSNMKSELYNIWKLCLALWGNHDELEGLEINSHQMNMGRRNLLSKWFEEQTRNKKFQNENNLNITNKVLEKLYTHQVNEAAELALDNMEAYQALLISQISSGESFRQLIQHQLATWEEFGIDEYIDKNILKIYMLLSGTQAMITKNGTIDVLENLHWVNVLAIHLWYLLSPTSSISEIVTTYEKIFKSDEFLVVPPKPDHIDSHLHKHIQNIFDLKYHLLQLYSTRNYSVDNIVNPLTYSSDILDYSVNWLILQILEVIGYKHCSEINREKLHLAFATQLENCNLWTWAIFVLLHINDQNKREMSVQQLLYRKIEIKTSKNYTEDEKFVINRLGIPEKWINWTKALKAGIQRNFKLQTDLYLRSEQWYFAYKVLMKHVIPDDIINEDFNYIRESLKMIENKFQVPNWANEGQIILSYIDICKKLTMIKLIHKKDMKARWNALNPVISDICSRLNQFPCPTSKHKLCQSEMAQKLTCLIRTFLLTWQDENTNKILKMTLGMLPLPQEFLQQELRFLFANMVTSAA